MNFDVMVYLMVIKPNKLIDKKLFQNSFCIQIGALHIRTSHLTVFLKQIPET